MARHRHQEGADEGKLEDPHWVYPLMCLIALAVLWFGLGVLFKS